MIIIKTVDITTKNDNNYELVQVKDRGKIFTRVNAVVEGQICLVALIQYWEMGRKVWMDKKMVKSFSRAYGIQEVVEWIDRHL